MEKNIILYGPPGTGKTYCTHLYAVSVIENRPLEALEKEEPGELRRRFQGYRQQGLIEFTTFHQSFSYEDFVEGIRPDVQENEGETGGNISYHVEAGVFKQFCDRAAGERFAESLKAETAALGEKLGVSGNSVIWKVSLAGTGNNPVRQECLDHGHIRIGWDLYGKDITEETVFTKGGKTVLNAFLHKMQPGDIVVSCYSEDLTDAVGVVIGEYEWHDEYSEYKRVRKVRWLVKNIRQSVVELNGGMKMTLSTVYQMKNVNLDELLDIVKQHRPAREERPVPASQGTDRRVFIIDEINRGNIAGIFGELITLIEPSKRLGAAEALKVRLPYSRQEFGVPDNVYVIGTMNTADRSLTGLDIALRRRFSFVHMPPKPELLAGKELCDSGVAVSDVLAVMNRRISVLLDQDHCLGHAPFLSLSEGKVRVDELARVFSGNVLPLLAEYFFEDWEKIRVVLNDHRKSNPELQFVCAVDDEDLFGPEYSFSRKQWRINEDALYRMDAYVSIVDSGRHCGATDGSPHEIDVFGYSRDNKGKKNMTPETLQEVVDKKLDVESPEYDNHVFVRFKNGQYAVYDAATGVKPENQAKYCLELIGKDELFASLREEMDFTNKNNTTTYVLIKAIIKKLADA